jgi:hypothetical protein
MDLDNSVERFVATICAMILICMVFLVFAVIVPTSPSQASELSELHNQTMLIEHQSELIIAALNNKTCTCAVNASQTVVVSAYGAYYYP